MLRHRSLAPGEVLLRLVGRVPSWAMAFGLAGHPSLLIPIVVLSLILGSLLGGLVYPLAVILTAFAALLGVGALVVKRRVAVLSQGDRVLVRNLWRSIAILPTDVSSVGTRLLPWSRGLYCLVVVVDSGNRVSVLASTTHRLRELERLLRAD